MPESFWQSLDTLASSTRADRTERRIVMAIPDLAPYKDLPVGGLRLFGRTIMDLSSQARWPIPDKVAIRVAPTGAFFTRDQNPSQPYTPEEILRESIEAVEAGACSVHVHVRDQNGIPSGDRAMTEKVVGGLRERYGADIHIDGEAVTGASFEQMMEPLLLDLYESAAINCFAAFFSETLVYETPQQCRATAEVLQAVGKGITLAVYNAGDIDNANRWLLQPGLVQPPFLWSICPALPGGAPMWDPISMCETLAQLVRRIREIDSRNDPPISVSSAGRASSYLTTLAMLLGCHVRVGKEDTIYLAPNKDDLIETNAQAVERTVAIARALGREPMTAVEYRKVIGLKPLEV
jgi:3-keto-5-aminohexanoate cleavage enzyme